MKLLSSVLLFIGSAAALTLDGVYHFRSESKASRGVGNFVTADVYISRISGRSEGYSLQVKNVKLENSNIDFSNSPLEFSMKDGQIIEVLTDPYEHYISKNLKKAIVESLQTNEIESSHEIIEVGGNGVKKVNYATTYDINQKVIQSSYSRDSFIEFPKDSGLDDKDFEVKANKNTYINIETDRIIQAQSQLELNFFSEFQKTKVKSNTLIDYVKPLDKVVEANGYLVKDTLIHTIDLEQRINRLRQTLGLNPVDYLNKLLTPNIPKQEYLKMEAKLLSLLGVDQMSANEIVEEIANKFSNTKERDSRLFFILSRIDSIESQKLLGEQLLESLSSKDAQVTYTILRSLNQLKHVTVDSPIISILKNTKFPEEVEEMAELTLGALCKHIPEEESKEILASYMKELELTQSPSRKVQLLHVLGNAKNNSPVRLISSFLQDHHEPVRSAAMFGLRDSMHKPEVQRVIKETFDKQDASRQTFVNLLKGMRDNKILKRKQGTELDSLIQKVSQENPETVQELPEALKSFMKDRMKGFGSSTSVWNDSSDPLYNFAAPLSQRQQDVDRYPSNEAYINVEMYGPRLANLKFVTGVFSGQARGDGCLAGNFKIFDHLYTETQLLGDSHLLADLELYILTYNNQFDSRIYGNINGNVILDLKIVSNCTSGIIPLYDGEIFIIDYSSEFPIDIGNVLVTAQVIAGLEFEIGYKLCLLVINPYVELYLKGSVELVVDLEVLVTVVGLFRGGVSGEVFLNYEVGPETQIGTRNNTGSLTCEACIGVYYGYAPQDASVSLWFQRRQGLGWGEPTVIPIFEWNEPGVPFPAPLVEECGDI